MSKGMIVLEMPITCQDCPFFIRDMRLRTGICAAWESLHDDMHILPEDCNKPKWCPIQKLPDKKPIVPQTDSSWISGWNACIDCINTPYVESQKGKRKKITERCAEKGENLMTLEERLTIIEERANKEKSDALKKAADLQMKTEKALRQIQELTPRIEAIITIVNKCIEEGVPLPSSSVTAKYGYGKGYRSYSFCADGICHHVGFMDCKRGWWKEGESRYKNVEYLGIDEGGCCGVWDFYTNGTETFLKHETDGTIKDPELYHMESFLKEFDLFEEAFYKWIDSMAESN